MKAFESISDIIKPKVYNSLRYEVNKMSLFNKEVLLKTLKDRFNKHVYRHPNIAWEEVEAALDTENA